MITVLEISFHKLKFKYNCKTGRQNSESDNLNYILNHAGG